MPDLIEIKDLPEEMLLQILKMLDYNEIVSISRLEFHWIGFKWFFFILRVNRLFARLCTEILLSEKMMLRGEELAGFKTEEMEKYP